MKAKIIQGRGTKSSQLEIGPSNWAGKGFLDYDKAKMASLSDEALISAKKGTVRVSKASFSRYPRKLPTGGYSLVTGRGTGIIHL